MSASSITRRAQRRTEAHMTDACTVKTVTGETTNATTGKVTPTYGAPIYSGACQLQSERQMFPTMPDSGEHEFTVAPLFLKVPVGAPQLPSGALVEITASFDAANVGRQLRIRMHDRKTYQSAVRYLVEELVA